MKHIASHVKPCSNKVDTTPYTGIRRRTEIVFLRNIYTHNFGHESGPRADALGSFYQAPTLSHHLGSQKSVPLSQSSSSTSCGPTQAGICFCMGAHNGVWRGVVASRGKQISKLKVPCFGLRTRLECIFRALGGPKCSFGWFGAVIL